MITLGEAAIKFRISEEVILRLIKQHKITSTRLGRTQMVDEVSLDMLICQNKQVSDYWMKCEQEIVFWEQALTDAILKLDGLVFLFNSVGKISPLLRVIINEMGAQISREEKRTVFIKIASGMDIPSVARECGMTEDKACRLFKETIKDLDNKLGFLHTYHKDIEEKNKEIYKLELINRNRLEYITTLTNIIDSYGYLDENELVANPEVHSSIPWICVQILSLNIMDNLNLDTRIENCFKALEIVTIEDLLRFIKKEGFNNFLRCQNFGKQSLAILKKELIGFGIIDETWNSNFFQYIEVAR